MPFTSTDFLSILPIVVIVLWACALLLVEAFVDAAKKAVPLLAAIGLAVGLGFAVAGATQKYVGFKGMVVADGFAGFLHVLFLFSGMVAIALAYNYNKRVGLDRPEFFVLLLFSISGMMLMAVAVDLIVVFLALELLSIPLYVMAGLLSRVAVEWMVYSRPLWVIFSAQSGPRHWRAVSPLFPRMVDIAAP